MHVAFVNLWRPPGLEEPAAVVAADLLRRELSRALLARGHRVTVVQEWHRDTILSDGGVRWRFVRLSHKTRAARALLRMAGRADAFVKAPSDAPLSVIREIHPDVLHSFDLSSWGSLLMLGRVAGSLRIPLLAHFHGGAPARLGPLRWVERRALRGCDRLLFTTRAHGLPWVESGALLDDQRIVELFETTSTFSPGAAPRLPGSPAGLAVCRLDAVKDPLCLIEGFRRLLQVLPAAELTIAFAEAPLLAEVRRAAVGLPIHLLGRVEDPQPLYRGADLFFQASRREVCGRAPLEAMASGLAPVLSDIPSFRRLTMEGRVGRLFRPGDPDDLACAALSIPDWAAEGRAARRSFDERLSPAALARDLGGIYLTCVQERRGRP